jgi:uncharacterized protein YecE (DUF72 family)
LATRTIRVGTSGFSYREWLGKFYPIGLKATEMLPFYASQLPTVEINYTFRRMPRAAMLTGWTAKTPADFRFALKAPELITHRKRLRDTAVDIDRFAGAAAHLGERLGPVLFQLGPDFKCDVDLLRDFLTQLDGRIRAAFEFRNRSWFNDDVLSALRNAGAALCIAESEKLSTPIERTAPFIYVRLRKPAYDDAALDEWTRRLIELAGGGGEAYVYFKHELDAPEYAARLARLLGDPR